MNTREAETSARTVLTFLGLAVCFFIWGMFLFLTIGDKGPPGWNFGTIDDVPGSSPYSTAGGQNNPGLTPQTIDRVRGQHVRGLDKPSAAMRGKTP